MPVDSEPVERVRLVADAAGMYLAVVDTGQVLVFKLPHLEVAAEIGIAGDLADHDVALVGGVLVVLTREGPQAVMHAVDPSGPTKLGELRFRTAARIAAASGTFVLTNTGGVIDVSRPELAMFPLPSRGAMTAAGAFGPNHFVLAVGKAIEEWDATTRAPGRRLRLDRPLDPLFVGGDGQRIWLVPRSEPHCIDLFSLSARAARRVEMPEPIAHVAPHANGTLLAFIGAETGRGYVLDLARQDPAIQLDRGALTAIAWIGGEVTLALKPVDGAIELLPFSSGEAAPRVERERDEEVSAPDDERVEPQPERAAARDASPLAAADDPKLWTREDISHRLAAWRTRHAADAEVSLADAPVARPGEVTRPHPGGWRGDIAAWARAIHAASYREIPWVGRTLLDDVVDRCPGGELLRPAVALLYGAYLLGSPRAPVLELAAVVHWNWQEALGRGALADTQLMQWRHGRVGLVPEVLAYLDERAPLTGNIFESARAANGKVALVAPADLAPMRVGEWAAANVGPLLVPNARGERQPHRFVLEGKLRDLAVLVPWTRLGGVLETPPQRSAILVERETDAAMLALPVVATWSA